MASKQNKKINLDMLNNQKIFLYVVLVGLLGFLVFYMFVYKKLEEDTATLHSQNVTLNERVTELKEVYDNIEAYEASTEIMSAAIKEVLSSYPADVREEDALVVAVDTLNKAHVEYSSITINDKEEVGKIDAETVAKAEIPEYTEEISVLKRSVSYVNSTDYINLKAIIGTILDYGGKKTIENIVYSKSEEEDKEDGFITGTIVVTDFVAEGTGAEYTAPELKEYEAGLYDLFGIIKNPNKK